jgi:hypothetical protein
VLRYYICLTACFLYTNEFKDFTLETAARNPRAGARQTRLQIARLISLFLFFFFFCGLRNSTLPKGVKPGLILTSPKAGLPQDMVVPRQGCQMKMSGWTGYRSIQTKHLFTSAVIKCQFCYWSYYVSHVISCH